MIMFCTCDPGIDDIFRLFRSIDGDNEDDDDGDEGDEEYAEDGVELVRVAST